MVGRGLESDALRQVQYLAPCEARRNTHHGIVLDHRRGAERQHSHRELFDRSAHKIVPDQPARGQSIHDAQDRHHLDVTQMMQEHSGMGVVKRARLEQVRQLARVRLHELDIASFADLVSCDGQGRLVQIDGGDVNRML